jgi:hypothetical protein
MVGGFPGWSMATEQGNVEKAPKRDLGRYRGKIIDASCRQSTVACVIMGSFKMS